VKPASAGESVRRRFAAGEEVDDDVDDAAASSSGWARLPSREELRVAEGVGDEVVARAGILLAWSRRGSADG
jgi:hypothetical protein